MGGQARHVLKREGIVANALHATRRRASAADARPVPLRAAENLVATDIAARASTSKDPDG